MTHKTILITGANGEIGHALINYFAEHGGVAVIAMDVTPMDAAIQSRCHKTIVGDILDPRLIQRFTVEYTFDVIY
ncbi:MAG: NAD-dependent epimerase/dehydratase family protein, partial [Chloroflexi bacterium]|nr:NAD-dependent epimerase/dehydratase family protein [Chloroflexota bacterium]